MPRPQNAMAIFMLLDKSNCRQCGEKTCMAFAGAVFTGRRHLSECPRLERHIIDACADAPQNRFDVEQNRDDYLEQLKNQIKGVDLREAAERTGGRHENDRLIIKVMGKDFSITQNGTISTDIHVNPWVAAPFLNYVLHGKGLVPTGDWRSFRELAEGRERYPLVSKAMRGTDEAGGGLAIPNSLTTWCKCSVAKRWIPSSSRISPWCCIPCPSCPSWCVTGCRKRECNPASMCFLIRQPIRTWISDRFSAWGPGWRRCLPVWPGGMDWRCLDDKSGKA